MSSFDVRAVTAAEFPARLREIPQQPQALYVRGTLPPPDVPLLTVVGTRQYSTYGKQVVDHLIDGLRGYRVGIVSGLALGIDSLAHEAALRNQLYTLVIPGSGLDDTVLYPRRHLRLAHRILDAGGGLLSEFTPDFRATKWSFIQRNRLMAGIAQATLVIEATEQSGTLTTARMCVDYNRELLVVPGNIFSQNSKGPHLFLKLGASPITTATDIVDLLQLVPVTPNDTKIQPVPTNLSNIESILLTCLTTPTDIETIVRQSGITITEANSTLMQLEIKGFIAAEHGIYRLLI